MVEALKNVGQLAAAQALLLIWCFAHLYRALKKMLTHIFIGERAFLQEPFLETVNLLHNSTSPHEFDHVYGEFDDVWRKVGEDGVKALDYMDRTWMSNVRRCLPRLLTSCQPLNLVLSPTALVILTIPFRTRTLAHETPRGSLQ